MSSNFEHFSVSGCSPALPRVRLSAREARVRAFRRPGRLDVAGGSKRPLARRKTAPPEHRVDRAAVRNLLVAVDIVADDDDVPGVYRRAALLRVADRRVGPGFLDKGSGRRGIQPVRHPIFVVGNEPRLHAPHERPGAETLEAPNVDHRQARAP